ncbi:hypothetical protein Rsub_00671 [Raphidocelis subcapitata]|uniref:Uncharacterized protein n=1 Tax=Raphidocelis subcapitata TaxID=307507 RepID=A0A2V0NLI5_9CHLO|nr:hypothetical protein Rsub_00671 [Raphidocelis subcapitata]|eukprot:GBF87959.1 hypothetical protein Rsub_00671 [Raphidocelis subcapitata]
MAPPPPPPLCQWLAAAAFAARVEPYKRIGAALLREDCVSLALSTPYQNVVAEPRVGGVMLHGGRVPARSLQRLVLKAAEAGEIGGWVVACERGTRDPALLSPERAATLRELVAALQAVRPPAAGPGSGSGGGEAGSSGGGVGGGGNAGQLPMCWHTHDPSAGPSCRIEPGGGGSGGGGGAAECNAGGQMLQSFLDGMGALNTFG